VVGRPGLKVRVVRFTGYVYLVTRISGQSLMGQARCLGDDVGRAQALAEG
jgi:hypothetical protein